MPAPHADFARLFRRKIGRSLLKHVPLANHSHFKIGGPADLFFEAASEQELTDAVGLARQSCFPYYVIGGGTNLLFDDRGYRGLIIKNAQRGMRRPGDDEVEVQSGTSIQDLVRFCLDKGLGGLEFLAGIPGTVGGGVFGNAGAFDKAIGSRVVGAVLLDSQGREIEADNDYFRFAYRNSILKSRHDLLLRVRLGVRPQPPKQIKGLVEETLQQRKARHPPWDVACAGSFFKNPVLPSGKKAAAALLLDQVGAKTCRVGGAAVYGAHSNFIVNTGGASAEDVLDLAGELKTRVKNRFGIVLEKEVIFLPADFSMP